MSEYIQFQIEVGKDNIGPPKTRITFQNTGCYCSLRYDIK